MKLTAGLILFAMISATAGNIYSQNARISLSMKNATIVDIFREIERSTEFGFFFKSEEMNLEKRQSINVSDATIDEVLKKVLDENCSYKILDKNIVVTRGSLDATQQQGSKVVGKVTDEKGQPLPGVTVLVKGSAKGVITDSAGNYFFSDIPENAILNFSFVGMKTQEISVSGKTTVNVSLEEEIIRLGEVVAVGYGIQKKVNLTGSISTVSNEQLVNRPVTNVASAIQGTMAGVTVLQNSGLPGDDFGTIRIRGIGTLNNADAMFVVDGIVVPNMNSINLEDIESISVLKDAASSAIYGSRAANGVILINTKKGKAGKVMVHYNTYIGKQTPTKLPNFLPSWQAASLYNEARINEGGTARYTNAEIQKFKDGSDLDNYPNTDWVGMLFKSGTGLHQNHFFDVSGGTEKTQAYFSLGYTDQEGIIKNVEDKRYSTSFRISSQIGSRLKVNGSLSYWLNKNATPTNPYRSGIAEDFNSSGFPEYIGMTYRISNMIPYKYSNGYYGFIANQGNPMAWLESGQQTKSSTDNIRAIFDADLEIAKGLHFKPKIGYSTNVWQQKNFTHDIQYYDHVTGAKSYYSGPSSLSDQTSYRYNVTLESLLQYDKSFGRHNLSVLAGYSQEYERSNSLGATRMNFLNHSVSELAVGPQAGWTNNGNAGDLALRSYFGRINYSFNNRYLLEGNIRYDGSSRFLPENRWGTFPSFSAGWRVSEENFFAPVKNVISQLKLRGSWGMLGNQNIGSYYPTYETISSSSNSGSGYTYSYGGLLSSGMAPYYGANRSVTWESVTASNFGVDAALYDGKITLTADYFNKLTDNILMNLPISAIYGQSVPYVNAAKMRNSGFEFVLGYHGEVNKFKYDIAGNASFIKNSVRDLKKTDPIINDCTFWEVPYPMNSYYGYQTEGLFQTQAEIDKAPIQPAGDKTRPGDIKYKDQNNDGKIDGNDRVYLGTYFPKVTYGLNLSMEWKGFDLALFFQGAGGVKGFVRNEMFGSLTEGVGKPTSIWLDRWTPDNPNADFPRAFTSNIQNSPTQYPSDFWIRTADYLRLKQLSFGYTLKSQFLGKAGIQSLRVYYSGANLFTFSKFYSWVDPEAVSNGVDGGRLYPMVKTSTIGLNLSF